MIDEENGELVTYKSLFKLIEFFTPKIERNTGDQKLNLT